MMAAIAPTQVVYQRPESLADVPSHYCPGCTHGVAHRLLLGAPRGHDETQRNAEPDETRSESHGKTLCEMES